MKIYSRICTRCGREVLEKDTTMTGCIICDWKRANDPSIEKERRRKIKQDEEWNKYVESRFKRWEQETKEQST